MCGTAICSFGIYNVHDQSGITEGALGLVLLLNHWFDIPSSLATPIIDIVCYVLAFRALGRKFLEVSAISTLSMAMFFRIWEHFPPVLPSLEDKPLLAALLGALFIGVGVGIVVKNGGSCGGCPGAVHSQGFRLAIVPSLPHKRSYRTGTIPHLHTL